MSFQISAATIADVNELCSLVNSAYRGETSRQGWTTEADLLDGGRTSPEILKEILGMAETIIMKYTEGKNILGCMELRQDHDRLYLGMLTVKPDLQGKGIGKIMLKAAEDEAKKRDCLSIYMTVISTRTELIDWYKRHGYSETGERKPFDFPDERWGIPKVKLEFVVLKKAMTF